ncbi:MAG: hypothetical protein ACREMY_02555, partial [bacterium]
DRRALLRTLVAASSEAGDGLPMSADEIEFFRSVSGGREPPRKRVREQWWIVGRRGGKDSVISAMATFAAVSFNQQHILRPGEHAHVVCLACDRAQAKEVLDLIRAYFTNIELLQGLVVRETIEGFELSNRVRIAVLTNSFRAVRGRTVLLAILDEVAYWRDETSAKPDEALYDAVKPCLLTLCPHSRLVGISSPYRKAGLLWKKYAAHFGKDDDDVLVVQAASSTMNATLPQEVIDREMAKDRAAAIAEYGAQFRDDVGGWLPMEIIEASVARGVTVRAPNRWQEYRSFTDASGGRSDSFTMCIAHDENGTAVLDCLVEIKPPFNPMEAVAQIASVLREYGLSETTGDRYAAEFNVSMFALHGISYRNSDRDRSAIYQDALPLFTSGRALILDIPKLVGQFVSLERKTSPNGRDSINHPPGGHDDLCNSAAGALVAASAPDRRPRLYFS